MHFYRCSAIENWNVNGRNDGGNVDNKVDPGPQVLACLFRAGYDTEKPLGTECTKEVQRVLKERAVRVKLMPEIEENCREALTEFCSLNIRPSEVFSVGAFANFIVFLLRNWNVFKITLRVSSSSSIIHVATKQFLTLPS